MKIYHYPELKSTNDELRVLVKKNAKDLTVVVADNQTQGRGYSGNTWQSSKGKSLTFSILFKFPKGYSEGVFFNKWFTLSIQSVLKNVVPNIQIKWPNDLFINHKKIGGILIESLSHEHETCFICGVGINVNQEEFEQLPQASSLFLEGGRRFKVHDILSYILKKLQYQSIFLSSLDKEEIDERYQNALYGMNQWRTFRFNGTTFTGQFMGANEKGMAVLKLENEQKMEFNLKELEWL